MSAASEEDQALERRWLEGEMEEEEDRVAWEEEQRRAEEYEAYRAAD